MERPEQPKRLERPELPAEDKRLIAVLHEELRASSEKSPDDGGRTSASVAKSSDILGPEIKVERMDGISGFKVTMPPAAPPGVHFKLSLSSNDVLDVLVSYSSVGTLG